MKRAVVVALVGVAMLLAFAAPAFAAGTAPPATYRLTISTYWDKDSDGVWDANEGVLPGAECVLQVNGVVRYVTTDKCGAAKVLIAAGATVIARPALNPIAGYPAYQVTQATPRLSAAQPHTAKVVMNGNRCMRFGLAPDKQTLTVGMDPNFPPFESIQNGQVVGFDVDLVKEIAARLGFAVEFKNYPFDELIPRIQNGEFDMIASAMTISEGRKELVDFSDPYFNADACMVVAADSALTSTGDLGPGDEVAVQGGTTSEWWATQNLAPKGVTVTAYDNGVDAFDAVGAGDATAGIFDRWFAEYLLTNPARTERIVQGIPTGEQFGFGFQKGDALRSSVNTALQGVKADGTYADIYETWFGVAPASIP